MAIVGDGKIPPEITRAATERTRELSPAEAMHVHASLKSTLEKLGLVGVITVDPKVQAQELTTSVGEEITRMIAQQKKLEKRFEELVLAQHHLRTLTNPTKLRENQAELRKVAEELRLSTKQLCRNLKDNPNVTENMAKVATERQALQQLLAATLNELEVFRKVQPLAESVMAQEASELQMQHTIEHERTTTSNVRTLRNDLKDEKIDHEEKMREKKKLVFGLKENLAETKMSSAVDVRFQEKDRVAKNEHLRRLEQTRLEDMRRELVLVKQQTEIETNVGNATADFLKAMATKLQEQSINWGSRLDEDFAKRENDLETLKSNHARDSQKLADMEALHASELRLKQEREQKEKDALDQASLEKKHAAMRLKATIIIQAYCRGWLMRKNMGGKGKKGKGKGGKKKK